MRTRILALLIAVVAAGSMTSVVLADVTSDRAAAILIFPRVLASRSNDTLDAIDLQFVTDTLIQISNTSQQPVDLHCFYVNATGHCSLSGVACDTSGDPELACPEERDLCLPQWSETDFDVVLTPRQPLAWRASIGLLRDDLPLNGSSLKGPNGESNSGTLVPPVRLRPASTTAPDTEVSIFAGELKCIVVDETGRAAASNVIKGEATVVSDFSSNLSIGGVNVPETSRYNAIGILAIDGDANDDGVLELGGGANEYNGCPNVLIVQHFFDGAFVPPFPMRAVESELTLVPCTQNFRIGQPGTTTAQFLVFNEFEQRFSTSARVDCIFRSLLSSIDTRQPERSIFSVGVSGTLAGQTRIRGVSAGLLGILTESYGGEDNVGYASGDDAFNLGLQGDREAPDFITVP